MSDSWTSGRPGARAVCRWDQPGCAGGRYEADRGYEPWAGYAGIALEHYDFGHLQRYFLGQEVGSWTEDGDAWLLGCNCGEVGCWPVAVRISVSADTYTWSHFGQPHREEWD